MRPRNLSKRVHLVDSHVQLISDDKLEKLADVAFEFLTGFYVAEQRWAGDL